MSAPADELPIQRRATPAYRLLRAVLTPVLRLVFRIEVSGREQIPGDGPYVLIANHLNWLDNFAILLAFPAEPRIHFLADPELLRRRRVQWWVVRKTAGYIAVDVHKEVDLELRRRVLECLRLGAVVAIYPEGRYGTREGELQPFKKGFAHFALQAGELPVLPVALSGTKDLWLGKRVRVAIGSPVRASGDVDELVRVARHRMERLLPPYSESAGLKPLRRFLTGLF
jgi:1-acyl-sn-glycerol-3-phosphate acyltransferase